MKKHFLMGLMTLAGVSILTSCQQDEQVSEPLQSPSHLQVKATIGTLGNETRALKTNTVFDNGDELGLYVTNAAGTALYNTSSGNIKATKSGTGWTLAQTISLSSTAGKVYAYFPYSATESSAISGMNTIAVKPGQTDYMWGISDEVTASSPKADIKMKHALSCIIVKLSNQGSPNGCLLSGSSLQNASASVFYKDGTMNITTGAITSGTAENLSYTQDANFKNSQVSLQHLVLPTGKNIAAGDCKFVFAIDGKQYAYNVPALTGGYKAGFKYTYSFVMKGSDLVLDEDDPSGNGGISITPWEDGGEIDGGTFE